jgi:hypothetical protein
MPIEVYIHTANVLYLLSYLVRKIFLLRFLTIIAGLVLIPYFFLASEDGPLWPAIIWAGVFFAVNMYQLIALFKERRPVKLNAEDQEVYDLSFAAFTVKQFADLLKAGQRKNMEAGEVLVEGGSVPEGVHVIVSGKVNKDGVPTLENGSLVGELSYITKSPAQSSTVAAEPLEVIYWENQSLTKVLGSNPELKSAWQGMLSERLAERLS